MAIIEVKSKDEFNNFILQNDGNFQQSWDWGELQERMGREIKRLLMTENQKPQVAASFVKHNLPLGKHYWLAARGPVILEEQSDDRILDSIASLQNDILRDAIFIRLEPEVKKQQATRPTDLEATQGGRASYQLQPAPHDHSPRATILIDLAKSEEELLADMHSKTRYNIGLASRKGVKILLSPEWSGAESKGPSTHRPFDKLRVEQVVSKVEPQAQGGISGEQSRIAGSRTKAKNFLDLLETTAKRDKFSIHPRKYYEYMLELPFMKLFTAEYRGGLIAGAIVAFWGSKATYLHGASSYEHRQLMAPHLLHWEIIKAAKQAGLKHYDLGGVSPKSRPAPSWAGMTRFKAGFGGEYVEYVGTLDYVMKPGWYGLYQIGRKILN